MRQPSDIPLLLEVPLKRLSQVYPIIYASAIALKRSAQTPAAAATIARQIAAAWTTCLNQPEFWQALPLPPAALLHLQLQPTDAGLIQIQVPDMAIAHWLDDLLAPVQLEGCPPATAVSIPFAIHHAHARCCSLLQLADREGLIALTRTMEHPRGWQLSTPHSITWLTAEGQLRLSEPADRSLISQLFAALESRLRLPSRPAGDLAALKLVTVIAQALQTFHAAHPLFGQGAPTATLQAQVALLLVTQRVLYRLMAENLGIEAAIEL